ncbi:MAG: response regulator transcription factor [Sterolibacteriaceae bacterium MAG5]|nr:response regulator transcription factor [Candidatus Nitricoxidireducens bremensis]
MIDILIVDDHDILRAGLKHILSETGDIAVTAEAGNGIEALARLRNGRWDAMVLDMSMPGKSGVDLIRQIKQEFPKLPILVLSMHREDIYAVRAFKAGAAGYLCKDNAEAQLAQAIRKVAGGGVFISPAVAEKLAVDMLQGHTLDALPHAQLSDREYEVFQHLVAGEGLTEIGRQLNLSVKTVSTHKTRIMEKLGLGNAAELVRYAIRHGLLADQDGP